MDPTVYNSTEWCGLLFSSNSLFASCIAVIVIFAQVFSLLKFEKNVFIQKLNQADIAALVQGCNYDLCALEGKPYKQNNLKCSIYATFAAKCQNYAATNGITFNLATWRDAVSCRKSLALNIPLN